MTFRLPARLRRPVRAIAAALMLTLGLVSTAQAAPLTASHSTTTYHTVKIDGVDIFYREAGPSDAPTIVLLHGFPTSSRQYEALIPLLATRYHIIAPDYPGFGQSAAPDPATFSYTFDHLAQVVERLLTGLKLSRYSLYVHDYGAPVGFRLMLAHPERVRSLVVQNGNAYEEGLGKKWPAIARYWADPDQNQIVVDTFLSLETTIQRHTAGSSHPERYNPEAWQDEFASLARPSQRAIQSALLYDYRTNVAAYPRWQAWLRKHRPPTLVVWGANDPSFIGPGGEAFRKDVPDAEIHLLDAGHFALDEKTDEIATLMLDFLAKHPQ